MRSLLTRQTVNSIDTLTRDAAELLLISPTPKNDGNDSTVQNATALVSHAAFDTLGREKVFQRTALLGHIVAQHLNGREATSVRPNDARLLINVAAPSTTVLCGVQVRRRALAPADRAGLRQIARARRAARERAVAASGARRPRRRDAVDARLDVRRRERSGLTVQAALRDCHRRHGVAPLRGGLPQQRQRRVRQRGRGPDNGHRLVRPELGRSR